MGPAPDGRYDSRYPLEESSAYLEQIGESVKRVSSIAYYRRYAFTQDEKITDAAITDELLARRERQSVYFNNATSGTATVISYREGRVALLTCAHVVVYPDTLVTYFIGKDRRRTDIIATIALKKKQSVFVAALPEGPEVELLAFDRDADLALLGRRYEGTPPTGIRPLPCVWGRARDLGWGTFLYLFGYPSGLKVVTKGIVSSPNKDRKGSFLLDAVFSRGFSGGIALALRDGVPNFEMVGMVKLVSAHTSYVLGPEQSEDNAEFDSTVPYAGDVYVQRHTDLEYGISQAIAAETILEFLDAQMEHLATQGYHLDPVRGPS